MSKLRDARTKLWVQRLNEPRPEVMAEIGVWRGEFAAEILRQVPSIRRYYMIDPWRHLPAWNKPFNLDDAALEVIFEEAMKAADFAANRRIILRGTTSEVADQIADGELDFAYIDGERGIVVDMIRIFPKIKPRAYIGGDDFTPDIWSHGAKFEPTLVFPHVLYFAEGVGAELSALGHFAVFDAQSKPLRIS